MADGNPVLNRIDPTSTRALRVIQIDPAERIDFRQSGVAAEIIKHKDIEDWPKEELVVRCLLTVATVPVLRELMGQWISGSSTAAVKKFIERKQIMFV